MSEIDEAAEEQYLQCPACGEDWYGGPCAPIFRAGAAYAKSQDKATAIGSFLLFIWLSGALSGFVITFLCFHFGVI